MARSFYIIDGHAQIFRAFFAPFRDLTSPAGEPTKATYVFTQMLINLVLQRKPDYLAMVIDSGDAGVFRTQIYPEYKANRKETPLDFFPQEKRILEIVRESGVPIFVKAGFEADDLIATMAKRLCNQGYDIFMVSKDKDLRQILNDCTFMYDPQSNEVIDAKKMEAKVGYAPAEAVEVQTLMGDAIDNVPGIPGVGEKTAAKLIKQYGKVENILQHLDELTPKLRENFQKFSDKLPLSRQLVTLKDDVDFDFDPAACEFKGLNVDPMRRTLASLGFRTLAARLDEVPKLGGNGQSEKRGSGTLSGAEKKGSGAFSESLFGHLDTETSAPPAPELETCSGCNYQIIDTEKKLAAFVKDLKKQNTFAFDTETDALGALESNMVGMSFSWEKGTGWYLPVRGPDGSVHLDEATALAALGPIFEDTKIKKVGHNLKYDISVLRKVGVTVRGVVLDTMIAAFLLDPSRLQYGIDRLALEMLKFKKIATEELIGKGKMQLSMVRVPLDRICTYASEDADIAWRLYQLLSPKLAELTDLQKLNDDVEVPLIDVLVEMESNGIAIDPKILKHQSDAMGEKIDKLRGEIFIAAGTEFNPDSPKQLAEVLFDRLKLKVVKRTKTGPSTDIEVLEKLAMEHPVPKLLVDYRSMVKLKNTYLDNLPQCINAQTGRIHASFSQIGAATGRLSCSDPNLQNIPIRTDEGRQIRSAFVPGDPKRNVLLTADYSQIELRFLAHFTEEAALVKSFAEDEDVHKTVAAEVFNVSQENVTREQRAQAKIVNFGIIYGVSAYGLARRIDGMDARAAQRLIDDYHRRFPKIKQFLDQCVMHAREYGYVQTILGRRRPVPDINSAVLSIRNAAERVAINSVVQGSAADLIKIAMNNVYRALKNQNRPSKMLVQVHDELVFETPADQVEKEAELVRTEMTSAMTLKVPLKVEIGWAKNWQEVK